MEVNSAKCSSNDPSAFKVKCLGAIPQTEQEEKSYVRLLVGNMEWKTMPTAMPGLTTS